MSILPGHVAVLNFFNNTPIDHKLDMVEWDQTALDLVDKGMLVADRQNRTYSLTSQGKNLLRILQEQEEKEIARREEEKAKKKEIAQPRIDVITELVKTMEADERLLLFRHLEKSFCFTSGANR